MSNLNNVSAIAATAIAQETYRDIADQSNLTRSQLLIWLGQRLNPEAPLYNMVHTFTIKGVINPVKFRQAFQALVDRSDALRTIIEEIEGVPQQRVLVGVACQIEYLDFSREGDPQAIFEPWLDRRCKRLLDLNCCLFDSVLIKLGAEKFVWYLNQHHLITDVLAFALVYNAVGTFYQLALEDRLSEAPALPFYQTYLAHERAYRQSANFAKAEAFWQEKLAVLPEPTNFYGRSLTDQNGTRTKRVACDLGLQRSLKLRGIAMEDGIRTLSADMSLFHMFTAVLSTYLYHIGGQERIAIGTPFHNRSKRVFKETIGLFINIYPLQIDLAADETFLSLIKKSMVETFTTLRYAHHDINSTAYSRAYDILLNYLTATFADFNGVPTENRWIHPDHSDGNHSLRLQIHDFADSGNFVLNFDFNCKIFDETRQRWVIQHFLQILDALIANREQPIRQVNLLSTTEWEKLVVDFNQTTRPYPIDKTVAHLFEDQVARTPEAIALRCGQQTLTYDQLNRRANQLAHYLIEQEVGPEVLVGLCVERSPEAIIGMLGILKAGGAYVPLDPDYPQARLTFMLADTQMPLLLSQQHLLEKLPRFETRVLCLDADWGQMTDYPEVNPAPLATADNLAYVIYTSGSTGRPKGAMIQHRGLTNYVWWAKQQYLAPILGNDQLNIALFSSLSFDLTVTSIFPPLICGDQIVIYGQAGAASNLAILDVINDNAVEIIKLTPAHLALVKALDLSNSNLKRMIVGGEDFKREVAQAIWGRFGGEIEIYNEYGPTEAVVGCMIHQFDPGQDAARSVPIGSPAANAQIYILNSDGHPVPPGISGEMVVAGDGVARGYLNRPTLTAKRFVPNPFQPGAVMYRTGDLARWSATGQIEFLGRADDQVKIKGVRIELGEIEAELLTHPEIKTAVVDVFQANPIESATEKRLVAYYVASQPLSSPELQQFLGQMLPEMMVPTIFVHLEQLPLTQNGKVNRKVLPDPEKYLEQPDRLYVAPMSEQEQRLADIWAEVFRRERVSTHDNFFDLGGDSIISIQIIVKASQAGLHLTPKQLFEYQTVAELAAVAGTASTVNAEQGLVTGAIPLTPIQHWFFEQNLPQPNHWNQSQLIDMPPNVEPDLLERAIRQLLLQHDTLRLQFTQAEGGQQQINVLIGPTVSLERLDLADLSSVEQQRVINQCMARLEASHDLSDGSLLQAAHFYFGPDRPSQLFLSVHHVAIDGVSWQMLLQDIETVYQQLRQKARIELPAKTTSFKQWAIGLVEYAQSATLARELPYWQTVLKDAIPDIPTDFAAAADNLEASTHIVSVSLSQAETTALLEEVPGAYNTQINDVLLAALAQTFADWTGRRSFLTNLEGHGREDILPNVDLSRTVGWFTSLFPVALILPGQDDPGEILKSVKEQLRQIPERGIGYGLLRYLSQDKATHQTLKDLPEPQVLFNYLGQFDRALPNSDLFNLNHALMGSHAPEGQRRHLLDINTFVINGRLQMDWTFSQNVHRQQTIERVANEYAATLRRLITHCLSPAAGGVTPSDFPLARLSQAELDQILTTTAEVEDIYPLSSLQQGMLFHSLYAPGSGFYVLQFSGMLPPRLDVAAFAQAWHEIINRHAILRTRFEWENLKQPLQIVQPKAKLPVFIEDWRHLTATEQQQQLEAAQHDRWRGFELAGVPLMSVIFVRLTDEQYRFIWNFHHVLFDRQSMAPIFEDVFALYQAINQGQPLPPKPIHHYRDYIAWVERQGLADAKRYWRDVLQGFTQPTPLLNDRDPGGVPNDEANFGRNLFSLTVVETNCLKALAQQQRLTLNSIIQGAWGLLLSYWSGQDDVLFGSIVPGRRAEIPGSQRTVGLFMNTLPMRVRVDSEADLLGWLSRHQQDQVAMRQFDYSPLIEVQGWSEVPRGQPLFDSVISVQSAAPGQPLVLDLARDFGMVDFDLVDWNSLPLSLAIDVGERVEVVMKYAHSRFSGATGIQMAHHFQTLLQTIGQNPAVKINALFEELTNLDRTAQGQKLKAHKKLSLQKLKRTKRKSISITKEG